MTHFIGKNAPRDAVNSSAHVQTFRDGLGFWAWKHFAASIAECVLRTVSRIVLRSILIVAERTISLILANQKRAESSKMALLLLDEDTLKKKEKKKKKKKWNRQVGRNSKLIG